MRKVLISLLFILILTLPAFADYTVDDVSFSAEVAANGRAQVTTTVQLTFDSVTTEVAIPLPDKNATGISAGDYRFSLQESEEGTDLVLRKKDGFLGVQTFQVHYTVPYSGDGGGDYSLGFLSSRWAKVIGGCSFQVIMPKAFPEDAQIISGYYGVLSPYDSSYVSTETSFGGSVGERMAFDSLSMTIALPEGYFTVRQTTLPVVSLTYLTVGMLAVLALMILYWRLKLRSARSPVSSRILLPEGVLPGQLPLVLDGYTVDIAATILDWANLGYLTITRTQSGIVVLQKRMNMGTERSKAERRLFLRIFGQKTKVAATPGRYSGPAARFRKSARGTLYRVILDPKGGNPVLVQFPAKVLLAVAIGAATARILPEGGGFIVLAVLLGLISFGYSHFLHQVLLDLLAHRRFTSLTALCLIIVIVLVPFSLLSGALPEMLTGLGAILFSALATMTGPRRSQRGVEAMSQAKGLRVFYRRVSWHRLQIYQGKSSRFFQNQLPKAVALGVDRSFAARFERLAVPMPEWLKLSPAADHSALSLQKQLAPLIRQLRESFR